MSAMDKTRLRQILEDNHQFTPTRKKSLYSNFARLEDANPDGFEANLEAWKSVLGEAIEEHVFDDATNLDAGPALIKALADPQSGYPLSLDTVIDHMVQTQELVPLPWFMSMTTYAVLSQSWRPGSIVRSLAFWAASKVIDTTWHSADKSGDLKQVKYVDIECLKERASALLHAIAETSQTLLSMEDVEMIAKPLALSALDVQCCLIYLSREIQALGYDRLRGIVKLGSDTPPSMRKKQKVTITDEDAAIVDMRAQSERLRQRSDALSAQILEATDNAKKAMRNGNKSAARRALIQRTPLLRAQEHASALAEQLETILSRIEEAKTNQAAVAVMEQSRQVMETINSSTGADKVDDLVDSLRDEMADIDSVTEGLSGLSVEDAEREAELDAELEDLEKAEAEKKVADKLSALPDAPSKPVSKKSSQKQSQPTERRREQQLEPA